MDFAGRIAELGLILPPAAAAVANYVPAHVSGNMLIISGQLCFGEDGKLADTYKGKLGGPVSLADGTNAAFLAGLNVLSQAQLALGSLNRIGRCLRLGGFINVTPDFIAMPQVMNGASDLMVAVFGAAGRHARTTIGVASLPLDACVEVDAMFELAA